MKAIKENQVLYMQESPQTHWKRTRSFLGHWHSSNIEDLMIWTLNKTLSSRGAFIIGCGGASITQIGLNSHIGVVSIAKGKRKLPV